MIYLVVASLLWAFSFGLIKSQLTGLDPVVVACGRLALATAVFAPFIVRGRLPWALIRRALLLGSVQFGLMYVLYLASYAWLESWQVAVLTIFTPLYVVLIDAARERRLTVRHWGASLVAVAGAALVVKGDPSGAAWRGVVLLQGANICFAYGQLRYRGLSRDAGRRDAPLIGWMHGGGMAVTVLAVFARTGGHWPSFVGWSSAALGTLLYLGILPTGLGFYLWNRGAARTGSGVLAVANNLKIPLAVLVSWAVFGAAVPLLRVLLALLLMVAALGWVRPRPGHD